MKFFNIVIWILATHLVFTFKQFKDENAQKVISKMTKKQIIAVLFVLKHHQHYQQIQKGSFEQNLQKWINSDIAVPKFEIYQANLPQNIFLQERFKVKRFPYLGFIIKTERGQIIYYKMRSNVVQKNVRSQSYLLKSFVMNIQQITTYSSKIAYPYHICQINAKKITGMERPQFELAYQLNDIYGSFLFFNTESKNAPAFICRPDNISQQKIQINQFHEQITCMLFRQSILQFSEEYYKMVKQNEVLKNKHIFLLVLDSILMRQKAQSQLQLLHKIYRQFHNDIIIFWIEAAINTQKKVLLGFKKQQQPPLIGLLPTNQISQHFTLTKQNFNIKNIRSYFLATIEKLKSSWFEQIEKYVKEQLPKKWIHIGTKAIANVKSNLLFYQFSENQQKQVIQFISYSISRINRFLFFDEDKIPVYIIQYFQYNLQLNIQTKPGLFLKTKQPQATYKKIQIDTDITNKYQFCQKLVEEITKHIDLYIPPNLCIPQQFLDQFLLTNQYDSITH